MLCRLRNEKISLNVQTGAFNVSDRIDSLYVNISGIVRDTSLHNETQTHCSIFKVLLRLNATNKYHCLAMVQLQIIMIMTVYSLCGELYTGTLSKQLQMSTHFGHRYCVECYTDFIINVMRSNELSIFMQCR